MIRKELRAVGQRQHKVYKLDTRNVKDGFKVAPATVEVMQRGLEGKVPPDSEPMASEAPDACKLDSSCSTLVLTWRRWTWCSNHSTSVNCWWTPVQPTTPAVPSILATMRDD